MNAKEMRMKERLDILIQLGLEEDDLEGIDLENYSECFAFCGY